MKRKRKCQKCRELFYPDPRSYRPMAGNPTIRKSCQHYCSKPGCKQASRRETNKKQWMKDPELRERNSLASRCWREKNKGYWRKRRRRDPAYTKRNRERQRRRDQVDLANTDTINSLRYEKLKRISILVDLANTDPIKISTTLISEEIVLFLMWRERLANTSTIAVKALDESQSSS